MDEINKLAEKYNEVLKLYPDNNIFMYMHTVAGGIIGASGKYRNDNMLDILAEVCNLYMIRNMQSIEESFLLLSDDARHFINACLDWILAHPYETIKP